MSCEGLEAFVFEDALEIIIVFDGSGQIIYGNASAKQKLEYGGELIGKRAEAIFPGAFANENGEFKITCVIGEACHAMAYRKNQTCFPVEMKVICDKTNARFACMAEDVLEKEYLSRELDKIKQDTQDIMRVKSEFVANVTHELRTPVNGILGHVREMLPEEMEKKKLRQLNLIEHCCEQMNELINNILDFSKLEAGKFTLEPRRFAFRSMIDEVVANHKGIITEKGLDFFVTLSPNVPEYIVGDELRIVQVLNNLLSNARKFTSMGKITLEVIKTSQMKGSIELFFLVSDTGIGLEPHEKDKLFQSFSQVDASISRRYGGTGLGLSICRQLVELMGGSINVESVKGKGTTFSFSVWVEQDAETAVESGSDALPNPVDLFMDDDVDEGGVYDNPENRETLKKSLSKLILCVEMENWEKAEMFMENIRQLTVDAPQDISRGVLRLKMAVQKENYDKVSAGIENIRTLIDAQEEADV